MEDSRYEHAQCIGDSLCAPWKANDDRLPHDACNQGRKHGSRHASPPERVQRLLDPWQRIKSVFYTDEERPYSIMFLALGRGRIVRDHPDKMSYEAFW